jgi:hypothetical protein
MLQELAKGYILDCKENRFVVMGCVFGTEDQ